METSNGQRFDRYPLGVMDEIIIRPGFGPISSTFTSAHILNRGRNVVALVYAPTEKVEDGGTTWTDEREQAWRAAIRDVAKTFSERIDADGRPHILQWGPGRNDETEEPIG